jgi:Tol biopolymer transport system component
MALKKFLILSFSLALWLLSFKPGWAATWLDPELKWKTLETPHFAIHYHTELEEIAKRFAPIAEEVHTTMTKVLKYKLDLPTQVTLLDTTDYGNGFTRVFPYPNIVLYLSDLSGNLHPYKYDNYLRYLFLHEYTHALHLDIAEGGASLLRLLFGRVIFPNALSPTFIIEGLATYMETRYTNAGRGRDPRWEAMLRMDALEDNLKSIDQAAVATARWPGGHLRYLYGVEFLEYLAESYGEEKLISLAHSYGDFMFSLGIDGAFLFIYGKNLNFLWSEWLEHLNSKFKTQKAKLGKITEPQLLTQSGYYHVKPQWSADSQSIYYIKRDADDYPQIRRFNLASGKSEKLFEGMVFDDSLSLSPDGERLLFSKADTYKNFYTFKDLYWLDLASGKATQLTRGGRASDPGFSPDGRKIVFVRNEKGTKTLEIMEMNGSENKFAGINVAAGTQYFSPRFSPDGKKIVVAKRTPDGGQRIYLREVESSSETVLLKDDQSFTQANPCFSPDGRYVIFDGEGTGMVNLYACELATKKVYQITNVLGSAQMPAVSPDGRRIAYVSYSSRGYDIARLDFNPSEWKKVSPALATPPSPVAYRPSSLESPAIHDYNPFPTLLPRFWVPYGYDNENGSQTSIYIGGLDPLMQHFYYLNFGYDFAGKKPAYTFYYANNQFFPQIALSLSDLSTPYNWYGKAYWVREKENWLGFSFFNNRVFYEYDRQTFTFGFQNINLTNISSVELLVPQPSLGNLNAFFLTWNYKNTRVYPYSISPEDGLDLSWVVEVNTPVLKSDYAFTNYRAKLKDYFNLPLKHQVLLSSLNTFYSQGDQLSQSNFSWRYLSLRGYPRTYLAGNKGASLSFEYRFPLWYLEKGFLYGYTFFDRLWGILFFDVGGASFSPIDKLNLKRGLGAELNLDTSTLWGAYTFALKLGFAKGLDAGGVEQFYFSLGL